jgi:hypothetical protein
LLKNGEAVEIFFSVDFKDIGLPNDRRSADRWLLKKNSGSGHAANPANTTTSTLHASASVDKPMYIHRIECAKPCDSITTVFLSSFSPCQKHALSGSFQST